MPRHYPIGTRARALTLYSEGKLQKEIAAELGVTEKTIVAWRKNDNWDALRATAVLAGKAPDWGLRVLQLLAEQQAQLVELRATVAALAVRLKAA